jgi:serine phosphatase RsbU (regulator of sigma subunit)
VCVRFRTSSVGRYGSGMAAAREELDDGGEIPSAGELRADAAASRERILLAAGTLIEDRRASMAQIASAAKVSRSTLYRHFATRQALAEALDAHLEQRPAGHGLPGEPSPRVSTLPFQPPGRLGRERPLALEVTQVLDEVPPHLIGDQLVAETRRAAGVPVALYVVDIDGSQLIRLAGSDDFPETLVAPPALGPEIVPEGLPEYYERLRETLPRCVPAPLWLRGRVLGLLLCVGVPLTGLEDIARQGAAALELANDYTDLIEAARRRKPTSAAAEVQYHLLPPRIARITGAQLAGGLLPTYEVGGDWFDFVENRDGAWIAIADAAGTGPTAAGLGAGALGALRSARRAGEDLAGAAASMNAVIRELGNPQFSMTGILARWHAPTGTLAWINCGHLPGFLADLDGTLRPLEGPAHPPLGLADGDPEFAVSTLRLESGDRLVLVTDGITARTVEGGGTFGVDGLQRAVAEAPAPTAAATAMAIQRAVTRCWTEPLEDDATLVVLAVD